MTNTKAAAKLVPGMTIVASGKRLNVVSVTPLPNGIVEIGYTDPRQRVKRPTYRNVSEVADIEIAPNE